MSSREPRPPWPIGVVLPTTLVGAIASMIGLGWLASRLVGGASGAAEVSVLLEAWKLVLAIIAGVGGAVALVVAYRRQRYNEIADHRAERAAQLERQTEQREVARLMNERFTAAVAQLGDDAPAIRLGGVHALAGLADDWTEGRQMCIDVLCSYLRMRVLTDRYQVVQPDNSNESRPALEVHAEILRTISDHLDGEGPDWSGNSFDLRSSVIDAPLSIGNVQLSGKIDLSGAEIRSTISVHDTDVVEPIILNFSHFFNGHFHISKSKISGGIAAISSTFESSSLQLEEVEITGTDHGHPLYPAVIFGYARTVPEAVEEIVVPSRFENSRIRINKVNIGRRRSVRFMAKFTECEIRVAKTNIGKHASVNFGSSTFGLVDMTYDNLTLSSSGRVSYDHCTFDSTSMRIGRSEFASGSRIKFDSVKVNEGCSVAISNSRTAPGVLPDTPCERVSFKIRQDIENYASDYRENS